MGDKTLEIRGRKWSEQGVGVVLAFRGRQRWEGLRHNHGVDPRDRCSCYNSTSKNKQKHGNCSSSCVCDLFSRCACERRGFEHYSTWQGMGSRACLVIKLESRHSLPYSRMSKKKTQQLRKELLQNRRKEAISRSLRERAGLGDWFTVGCWRKHQGTNSLNRPKADSLKGQDYEQLKEGNKMRIH